MKSFILICLLVFSLFSCSNVGTNSEQGDGSSANLNLDVKKYVLDNGLRVLIVENDKLPIYSYYTFYNVGGRHESSGTTGATHFLEHMMFKGAKKYGPGEFDTYIESNGGATNAYTSFDSTVYYQNLPSHTLETIIDMEADRMSNLLLEEKPFESERLVVLEERKYRYENSPKGQIYLAMMQNVFEKTPYGGSVIGSVADLKNLKRDKMRGFFETFYAPNNAIVVIVGDVDHYDTMDYIKKYYGKLKANPEISKLKESKDNPKRYRHRGRYRREVKLYGQAPNPIFALAYKGDPIGTRRSFVMDILSSILGDGDSSYLSQKYVKGKKPLLNSVSVGNYTLKYNGVFFVMGELLKKTNLNKFKRNLVRETTKLCNKAITDRTLQKTKNQYMIGYYRDIQTNKGIAHFLGLRENFYNDYAFYKKELEIYNSITTEEVKDVCKSVFSDKKYIFLSVWNKHKKGKK